MSTKEYMREYRKKPSVEKYIKEYRKKYYSRPDVKKRKKIWGEKYRSRPEIIQHYKEYRLRPEIKENLKKYNRKYSMTHKKEIFFKNLNRRRKVKKIVIKHYGGKCRCCGEKRIEFLITHHTNGGGTKHRKKIGFGQPFYEWLINHHFPKNLGIEVLCGNCHNAITYYKYCPHESFNIK